MQSLHLKTLAVALSLLLVACGGGGGAVATISPSPTVSLTPQQQIAALEANGALPKLDRSPNIEGPDANANGVRDDVDTYIAQNYPVPTQRAAVQQIASVLQSTLLVDTTDAVAVRAISSRSSRAINCIYVNFNGKNGSKKPSIVAREIESMTMNTKIRILKYMSYSKALNGSVMFLSEGNTCE